MGIGNKIEHGSKAIGESIAKMQDSVLERLYNCIDCLEISGLNLVNEKQALVKEVWHKN